MLSVAKDVDGGATTTLAEGVLDQIGTCATCVRYSLSKLMVTTTKSHIYTVLGGIGLIGGMAGVVLAFLGLLDGLWAAASKRFCGGEEEDGAEAIQAASEQEEIVLSSVP